MSRFNNLEFNRGESQAQARPVLKDEAHYWREADSAFRRGQFDLALRHYAKVIEYNPGNASARAGQVRMLIELGDLAGANVWATSAVEKFPDHPEVMAAKAVVLGRLGDLEGAMAFSDNAVHAGHDHSYVWLSRADVLLAAKNKHVEYCFEKAAALAKGDWLENWLIVRILYYYEQFSIALKWAQQALALATGEAVVWFELGRCQSALGLAGLAEHSLRQAIELDPQCVAAEKELSSAKDTGFFKRVAGSVRQLFQK